MENLLKSEKNKFSLIKNKINVKDLQSENKRFKKILSNI